MTPGSTVVTTRNNHAAIRVLNFEETIAWYREKLGFEESVRWKALPRSGEDVPACLFGVQRG
jgi:catechol 2,3-dioxygenase-like lactoylglutathione lyase family enzyme